MMSLLKIWLSSWMSVRTEALSAAQLVGNAGTSIGSKAFAFINSIASSGTMGVAMLSVTLTTVVSTASVVYDVVLDPQSPLQSQAVVFDSGVITDDGYGQEFYLQDLMSAVHDPDEEHTIFTPWAPDEQWMIDSGLWTEDEVLSMFGDLDSFEDGSDTDSLSSLNTSTPVNIDNLGLTDEEPEDEPPSTPPPVPDESVIAPPPPPAVIGGLDAPPPSMVRPPPPLPPPPTDDIIIIEQPTAATTAEEGSIFFGIQVLASGPLTKTYQWYQNTTNSNTGGTPIDNRTIWPHVFLVPHELKVGTHYFYVVISAPGIASVTSNVAVITVVPPAPPVFHTLTIIDGGTGATVSGERQAGRNLNIDAGTKTDKVFYNWTVVSGNVSLVNPRNPLTSFAMPAHDVTIRANWTDKYEVIVNLFGGSGTTVSGWYDEGDTVSLDAGTLDGYVFSGWHITNNANPNPLTNSLATWLLGNNNTNPNTSFTMPDIHITISAEWVRQYQLTVVGGHGSNATQSGLHTFDAFIELDPGIHPDGLMLARWTRDPSGTISPRINPANPRIAWSTRMPASDMTVTAIWGRSVSLVSSNSTGSSGAGVYAQGDTVNLNAGTRAGYTFSHWEVTESPSGPPNPSAPPGQSVTVANANSRTSASFIMPDFPVTALAVWDEILYSVTITGGRSFMGVMGPTGQADYSPGASVGLFPGFEPGFEFSHWTIEPNQPLPNWQALPPGMPGMPTHSFTMPAYNVIVTAHWIQQQQVTVDDSYANAAHTGQGMRTPGQQVNIDAGTRAGWRFTGWTVELGTISLADSASQTTSFIMPNHPVTVKANWEQVFTVIVNPGGATGSSGSAQYAVGSTVTINAGTRAGHTFNGWSVELGTINLDDATSPTTTFTMPSEHVQVNANWTPIIYSVTVISDCGEASATPFVPGTSFTVDSAVGLVAGTRDGWILTGWTVEPTEPPIGLPLPPVQVFGMGSMHMFTMPAYNVTVTAIWESISPATQRATQLIIDSIEPPTPPTGDSTVPPEPETGEPPPPF